MDRLKECALSFSKLLDIEYHIAAGKKGELIEPILFFRKEHFYHLMGLQKLNDIQETRGDKTKIFNRILTDELTSQDLSKSEFFPDISDRLDYFTHLEYMIDSEDVLVRHNKYKSKSYIQADYIFYITMNDVIVHYFVERDDSMGKYFGKTFFTRVDRLYLWNRPYKILRKIKYENGLIINKFEQGTFRQPAHLSELGQLAMDEQKESD